MKRKVSSGVSVSIRRKSTLERLQAQLKSGVKTEKKSMDVKIPLTDKDKVRISKEIETIKARV